MESPAEQLSIGHMEAHTSSAENPGCPGQQQTAGPEVDLSQHRSRETETGFACSDGPIQTPGKALNPSFPALGHGEKGTEGPHRHDHPYHAQSQPRHDSIDSIASSMFSARRTNTGFSSIATSILEGGEPESPKEDPDDLPFDDPATPPNVPSSPAPKSFLPRAQTFQSPIPSRSGSLIQDSEGSALPHHPAVNLVSLARSSSPTPDSRSSTMPKERSIHKHIRFEPSLSRRSSLPMRPLAEHAASSSALRRSSERPSTSAETPPFPAPPGLGLRRAATRPSRLVTDWDRSSSPGDPLTPVPENPTPDSQTETTEASSFAEARDTDTAMTEQPGDGSSEAGTEPGTPPSADDITPGESPYSDSGSVRHMDLDGGRAAEDICDLILERTHGMQLRDLVVMQDEAWAAVNYCVDALTHIVDANAALPGQNSIPIRQRAPGVIGGGHAAWGAGNGGGSGGFNGFNGGYGDDFNGNHGGQPPASYPNGNSNGFGAGGQGNGGGPPMTPKRKSEDDTSKQTYCCPFRKRNPVKFNVRSHQTCATQSFPDISQVKRHVKTFHKRNSGMKFPCPRCKRNYDSNDGLAAHLLAPSEKMCQVRDKADEESDGDPEAGISDSTVEILNERKQNTKIDSWNALWKKLFPLDAHPKDHYFVPPVELDEVKEDFDGSWDRLRADLQAELGAASAHILDSVADRCQEHIRGVLEQSQDRVGECRQTHKRRRQESKVSIPGQGEPGAVDALGRHTYARLPGGSSNASNVSASPVDEPPETIDSGMWSQSMGPMPAPMSTRNYGSLAIPAPQPAGITVPGPVAPFHGTYSIGMRNESPKGQSPDQLDSAKVLDTPAVSASMEHFFVPSGTTEFDAYNLELANQYNGANGYDAYSHFPGMPYGNGSG